MNAIFEMWEFDVIHYPSVFDKEDPKKDGAFKYLKDNWNTVAPFVYKRPYHNIHKYVLYTILQDFHITSEEKRDISRFLNSKLLLSPSIIFLILPILLTPFYVYIVSLFFK